MIVGNECDFAHRSEYAGDHCDLPELIEAATGVKIDGSEMIYESTRQWYSKLNLNQRAETTEMETEAAEERIIRQPAGIELLLNGGLGMEVSFPSRLDLYVLYFDSSVLWRMHGKRRRVKRGS